MNFLLIQFNYGHLVFSIINVAWGVSFKTWQCMQSFLSHVLLICVRQEDFSSDGLFFLKEEGRLYTAGKCMSHPAGRAAPCWPWCSAIWTALHQLTGLVFYFIWLCSFSVLSICLFKEGTIVKCSFVLHMCQIVAFWKTIHLLSLLLMHSWLRVLLDCILC